MQIVEVIITVICLFSILCFLLYVVGLFRMPTGHRPQTPTFDRYGNPLPATLNPGFQETENEEQRN